MATRWWAATALVVGTMAGLAAVSHGHPQQSGGSKWTGGSAGGKSSPAQQIQAAIKRMESASSLQAAQADARRRADLIRGPVEIAAARPETPLDDATALAAVLAANGGKIPATGEDLQRVLARLGDFAQLPVPFSAVALESGLVNPRVVLAPRGGRLDPAPANRPALAGRLFLAANMVKPSSGDPRVRSVEFISWNPRRGKFDFGVIEDLGGDPHIRLLDGVRCFSCHKNRGPILGATPWSNTTHNEVVRAATELAFLPLPGTPRETPLGRIDGMTFFSPQAADVDDAVRLGASYAAHREGFRLLSRDADGRKALAAFLVGVVTPGTLEKNDIDASAVGNKLVERRFPALVGDWVAFRKAEKSGVLHDFNPAGSVSSESGAATGTPELVGRYDVGRILGDHRLVSLAQPSNPTAFSRPPLKALTHASQVVSAASLARTIGLSQGDRAFLGKSLSDSAKKVRRARVTAASLAQQVLDGPHFRPVFESGILPDREDFKERFVRGLDEVLRESHGVEAGFAPRREDYASGPVFAPLGKDEPEPRVIPTSACLRCHEVRGEGRAKFAEPLPAIAFDPFDKTGREAWLKTADRRRKQDVLDRMVQRVGVSKDMPPEDEPEYEHFRVNNPAAFDEVKQFLEAALKDAKGK